MTSEEALKRMCGKCRCCPFELGKCHCNEYNAIEKNLEVLEILKKYTTVEPHVEVINDCACSKEYYHKVKEWLENGKTD